MTIESILERIAIALEQLAGKPALTPEPKADPKPAGKAPKAEKTETITPKVENTDPSEDEITTVIQALLDQGKKAQILALNKEFGTEKWRPLLGTDKLAPWFVKLKGLAS